MYPLFESMRVENGRVFQVDYHQQRVARAFAVLFPTYSVLELSKVIEAIVIPFVGLHKLKISYGPSQFQVDITPYQSKIIQSLRLVDVSALNYAHKLSNRSELDVAFSQRGECDEVILVQDGRITDTSYSNLAFKYKDKWLTPATPLLAGTMRQVLLDQKIIEVADITVKNLATFEECKLINAMLMFEGAPVKVKNIVA